ncbi:MAG: hypothetical protein AAFX78_14465 [Cyanobacteria bacterium J06638_20]
MVADKTVVLAFSPFTLFVADGVPVILNPLVLLLKGMSGNRREDAGKDGWNFFILKLNKGIGFLGTLSFSGEGV